MGQDGTAPERGQPHIVIIGGGFGGLQAARALRGAPAAVTVIDRNNYHLFQPLLYQVATAGLSPAEIAEPIRTILRRQRNTQVVMAEVTGIDPAERTVTMGTDRLSYDLLVVATGACHSYFGRDEWERFAPGLKTVRDATHIRRRSLVAFERAEVEIDPEERKALLTFVIVGGGPTGVEIAGAIAELARKALAADFRRIDPTSARILLVEAGAHLVAGFPGSLPDDAKRALERLGVEVHVGERVEDVDGEGVVVTGRRISTRTVIWAAGVAASPAGRWLGAATDRAGRVAVLPDLSVPGHPNVFVIGDTASMSQDGKPLPGVAPVAMQQGRYVGRLLLDRLAGRPDPAPFRYRDKGSLATVGRAFAIAAFGRVRLRGLVAWVAWLVVHIYYLIGFENRMLVFLQWAWAYLTYRRGARLIVYDSDRAPTTPRLSSEATVASTTGRTRPEPPPAPARGPAPAP